MADKPADSIIPPASETIPPLAAGGVGPPPPPPATVALTEVYDSADPAVNRYYAGTDCASVVNGRIRVVGTVTPDTANVTGTIYYPDPADAEESLSLAADENNNSSTDGSWECIWYNVDVEAAEQIIISAGPPNRGSDSCTLHIVDDHSTDPCAARQNKNARVRAGAAQTPPPYLELLHAPTTVVAGQKFHVLLRGEPYAPKTDDDPTPHSALPARSEAVIFAAVPGSSTTTVLGKKVYHDETIQLVEFILPITVRQADLRFYSRYITDVTAAVLVDAIR